MNQKKFEEFKKESNIEIIEGLIKANNGYITSKQLTEFGIHRMYLNIMVKKGMIEKVGKGIYISNETIPDSYYIFSQMYPKAVFSHMTALYFYDLSIIAPYDIYDITVCNNYYNYNISKHDIFYVSKDIYELGLTEAEDNYGNKIKIYDIERCICDIIKSIKRMDIEHVKYSVREYIKSSKCNIAKVNEYASKMGVANEVMSFINLMYD